MITINLLPEKSRTRVANVEKEVILFILMLILVLIGLSFTQRWISHQVQSARELKEQKTAQKLELLKKIGNLNQLEKKNQELQAYIQAIKSIRAEQSRPVRFLDELVVKLPPERIWFESLDLNQDKHIDLTGVALDNQVFAEYVKNLRTSPNILDVILHQTSQKKIKDYSLVSFRCRINGDFAQKAGDTDE
ncbi:MAG: PilN domain-containing protein [Desulfohalobiaceae bacterium]|nr:PilN domain-containing protein [Desulfohalobiaceae bacterium]